jgi:succinate dehydrogenase/fumarate reductase flavoprotein subunit
VEQPGVEHDLLGPSPSLFKEGAVLINREGRRFTDERRSPAVEIARQPGREAWIVFDEALAAKFQGWPHFVATAPGIAYAYVADYRKCRQDIFHTGSSLADLARSLGVPPAAFTESIESHNAGSGPAITRPPFYALGPVRSYVVFTEGGLRVGEQGEVQREYGSVIVGLFAVGAVGQGGLLLEGHGHHLDWAFISGRRTGRDAPQWAESRAP